MYNKRVKAPHKKADNMGFLIMYLAVAIAAFVMYLGYLYHEARYTSKINNLSFGERMFFGGILSFAWIGTCILGAIVIAWMLLEALFTIVVDDLIPSGFGIGTLLQNMRERNLSSP